MYLNLALNNLCTFFRIKYPLIHTAMYLNCSSLKMALALSNLCTSTMYLNLALDNLCTFFRIKYPLITTAMYLIFKDGFGIK